MIDLISNVPIVVTVPKKHLNSLNIKIVYDSPIPAPINKKDSYATLIIENTSEGTLNYPLYSNREVKKAGPLRKIFSALGYFIFGAYAE